MNQALRIIVVGVIIIAFFWLLLLKINSLQNEIASLKHNQEVERITLIDSIKSVEFALFEDELKRRDSIYNLQIISLQNENKRLKSNYNRIFSDYSNIVIERPRW